MNKGYKTLVAEDKYSAFISNNVSDKDIEIPENKKSYVAVSNNGEYVRVNNLGRQSRISNSGWRAEIKNNGCGSYIANSGSQSDIIDNGFLSVIANSGACTKIDVMGNNSVCFSSGYCTAIKAKNGTWISLCEYEKNSLIPCILEPIFALSAQIGNENYKDFKRKDIKRNRILLFI